MDNDQVNGTILIVDDVLTNLDVFAFGLAQYNFRVETASSGQAALELSAKLIPDLILLDIVM